MDSNSNSSHGLDSFIQDSQGPIQEYCHESVSINRQVQYREAKEGERQEQEQVKERDVELINYPVVIDSNNILRASQVEGINLHVELNPSAVRKNIGRQQFEASLSTDGIDNDDSGFVLDTSEQEQNFIAKELHATAIYSMYLFGY